MPPARSCQHRPPQETSAGQAQQAMTSLRRRGRGSSYECERGPQHERKWDREQGAITPASALLLQPFGLIVGRCGFRAQRRRRTR